MTNLTHFKNFIGCDVSKNTLDFAIYAQGTSYGMFQHIQVMAAIQQNKTF